MLQAPAGPNPCHRRATCYLQTLRPQLAVADFKRVLQIEPKNDTVRAQLTSTQKLIRKIEFEKARRGMCGLRSPLR